ncbi:potassium transporter Kup [Variovorax sp. RHLX14]|uniref:potassium transporter Kup n=1 Tax=Variovorax sp. RHLX14 TaxID=1259731 RepID=UPI003F45922E
MSPSRQNLGVLTLSALGVVYGDIGTSPLYTMKEVFNPAHSLTMDAANIVGVVSTILWALMVVVTLKYVVLILRANNRGEGGIMALTALAAKAAGGTPRRHTVLLLVGVLGASMFYGDAVITPAISVLSAMEGLETITPALTPYVMPLSMAVIVGLFLGQRFGTAVVGKLFGPIVIVWFTVLALTGVVQIVAQPAILTALNPLRAVEFLQARGWHLFLVMGSIVLALTGAEALYADMGHFGKKPIRLAWSSFVLPALALNYMGQGALLMTDPGALANPFFWLFPTAWLIPAVVLATLASVIASQATISGAYSLTKQAIQLGLLPRMRILQTSEEEVGQIYVPLVNWLIMIAVLLAMVGFGTSSALASAYGIAVTLTMLITTLLTFFVVRHAWGYPLSLAWAATGAFLVVDLVLVIACSLKFWQGGWFPIVMGSVIFAVMATWRRGRELLIQHIQRDDPDLLPFIEALANDPEVRRVSRTAVYAVANAGTVPQALLHNLKHYQVLHDKNIILTVRFEDVPWVPDRARLTVEPLVNGFWRVVVSYGFKDVPDVPNALRLCLDKGLTIDLEMVSYFLSREIVIPTRGSGMTHWREALFAMMSRNAGNVGEFLQLPHNRVVELGTRVQI